MDTDLLKTFLEVYRTRHFGKAADNLYITRSAVSFRLKQLESLLGVILFDRERNNIKPTPAGERMLAHANAVLTALERAKQDVSLIEQHSVQLSIGMGHNIWESYLKRAIQPLYKTEHGLSLRTDVITSAVMAKKMAETTLDIALSFDPFHIDGIDTITLSQVNLLLVSTQANLHISDLALSHYVKVDWGTAFNITHAQELTALPLPVLHTSSAQIAHDFIIQNKGCAFLPEVMVTEDIACGKLHRVCDVKEIRRHVYASYALTSERMNEIEKVIGLLNRIA
ncbi:MULTISPECIES: LysR family transcriptional regulator [unclassified Shewanella]|uniref:LysR family transcriptional regulator n=1 Tax=unclassified Shewanella TaxID=196818 RepID=UPI0006D672A1|nr:MULTISPECIES: LysR family transcriptional regulator [unclassified Shewanella]KPZ70868.1 HTH-type transcriptional regulator GltC [Shewanella sp. P1-14-1]